MCLPEVAKAKSTSSLSRLSQLKWHRNRRLHKQTKEKPNLHKALNTSLEEHTNKEENQANHIPNNQCMSQVHVNCNADVTQEEHCKK